MHQAIDSTTKEEISNCSCCESVTVKSQMRRRFLKLWTATMSGTIMAGWVICGVIDFDGKIDRVKV